MKALLGVSLVWVLWCLPARAESVADLIDQLKSQNPDVRREAAQALGKLGPEAKDAVPALANALKDKNLFVRR